MPPTSEQIEEAVQYAAEVVDKVLPVGGVYDSDRVVADRTALRAAALREVLHLTLGQLSP